MHATRCLIVACLLTLAASGAGPARADAATTAPTATLMPPNVSLVETTMLRRPLHHLESIGGLRLPRIEVFLSGTGHVLHTVGWDERVPQRWSSVLQSPRPLPGKPELDDLLDGVRDGAGNAVDLALLQQADVVVVTFWAGWCGPCGSALTQLRKLMQADSTRRFVWITIESDPVKQRLQRQTVR